MILEEEAATVKVEGLGGARDKVFRMLGFLNLAVLFLHPVIEPVQGADRRVQRDIHTEVTQAAETGGDVEGNVVIAGPAREPRPGTVGQLHAGEFLQGGGPFVIEPVVVKEGSDIPPGLAFIPGLSQPGSFFNGDTFEILVLFQRTVECRGVAPLLEYATDRSEENTS